MGKGDVNEENDYMLKKDQDSRAQSEDRILYEIPEKLNVFQWICLGIFYLAFLFLIGFIIYFSATWSDLRPNEYA